MNIHNKMKIIIFGNNYKKENRNLLPILFKKIKEITTAAIGIEKNFLASLKSDGFALPESIKEITLDNLEADLAISLGGDGTFLKTAAFIGDKQIPIVGVNTGRLGFLADIASVEIEEHLDRLFGGAYCSTARTALELNCGLAGKFNGFHVALNEIAVLKQDSSSMINIFAYLNGEPLTNYQADGLIISTPTGSTAYSMSVGGPLVYPEANILILNPIAPHSLTIRPLIIPDYYEIRLKVESRTNSFLVSVDGRSEVFDEKTELIIKKAPYSVRVVKQYDHTFFSTLKEKLMWGIDQRGSLK